MTVAIRFYNGFLTLNEPISNLFTITCNHKATKQQRLYWSTRDTVKNFLCIQSKLCIEKKNINFVC